MNSLCEEYRAPLAAYALGERELDAAAREHLETCAECQRAYREYAAVAQTLPFTAPEASPPPELRDRIIAAVAAEAEPAPEAPRAALPREHRARRQGWGLWTALAASLVAALALLGWNLSLRSQLSAQELQVAASREGWQAMIALMNDPQVRSTPVAGSGARGTFWMAPGQEIACLMVQGMPPLAEGQVYQVWLLDDGQRVSGGVFEARNGNGWVIIRPGNTLDRYRTVVVTAEPRGGSPAPTGPQIMVGELSPAQS